MSESRTLVVSLFMSLACFVIVLELLRGKLHLRSVLAVIGVGLIVSAISVEVISRLRSLEPQTMYRSAALDMIAKDPRPAIWSAYLELARQHPWLGVGFGRALPSRPIISMKMPSFAASISTRQPTRTTCCSGSCWRWD